MISQPKTCGCAPISGGRWYLFSIQPGRPAVVVTLMQLSIFMTQTVPFLTTPATQDSSW
jgi:hypothetical protein